MEISSQTTVHALSMLVLTAVLWTNNRCQCHPNHSGPRFLLSEIGITRNYDHHLPCCPYGSDGYRPPELITYQPYQFRLPPRPSPSLRSKFPFSFDSFNVDIPVRVHVPWPLSDKTDVWAFGCVLMQVVSTGRSSASQDDNACLNYVNQVEGSRVPSLQTADNPGLDPLLMDSFNSMLTSCLMPEADKRPPTEELYKTLAKLGEDFTVTQSNDTGNCEVEVAIMMPFQTERNKSGGGILLKRLS